MRHGCHASHLVALTPMTQENGERTSAPPEPACSEVASARRARTPCQGPVSPHATTPAQKKAADGRGTPAGRRRLRESTTFDDFPANAIRATPTENRRNVHDPAPTPPTGDKRRRQEQIVDDPFGAATLPGNHGAFLGVETHRSSDTQMNFSSYGRRAGAEACPDHGQRGGRPPRALKRDRESNRSAPSPPRYRPCRRRG